MRVVLAAGLSSLLVFGAAGCDDVSPAHAQSSSEETVEIGGGGGDDESEEEAEDNPEASVDDLLVMDSKVELDGGAPADAVDDDSPLADYDLESLAEAWQGNWLIDMSRGSTKTAVKIEGAKIIKYNPYEVHKIVTDVWSSGPSLFNTENKASGFLKSAKEELKPHNFRIESPCSWAAFRTADDGDTTAYGTAFALGDDRKLAGPGWAGIVTDDGAVACRGDEIYELNDEGCAKWQRELGSSWDEGEWKKEEVECSLEDGTFETPTNDELERVGDILIGERMKKRDVQSFETFQAAKEAADDSSDYDYASSDDE